VNPIGVHRRSWPSRIARPGFGGRNYFFAFFLATFLTAFFAGFFAAFFAFFTAMGISPPLHLTHTGGQGIVEVAHKFIVLCSVFTQIAGPGQSAVFPPACGRYRHRFGPYLHLVGQYSNAKLLTASTVF
jgi:hypothetical protein